MNLVSLTTSEFDARLKGLADQKGKPRIRSAPLANFGDCAPVGDGVSEMRIHVGPGSRAYFIRRGTAIDLLLAGGDKSSQARDITRARTMARQLKEGDA